jgi:hypothetical protein
VYGRRVSTTTLAGLLPIGVPLSPFNASFAVLAAGSHAPFRAASELLN